MPAAPTFAQLIGQKLMVAMSGTTPDSALLGRIGRGEVGGVILFGSNITTAAALVALTTQLRNAAAAGGQPPLLIATDQEGGSVKRVSWAPPTLSPPQMGTNGSASTANSQGLATGKILLCGGINNNLAPVADVPSSTASFMYQQGRTWSFNASLTATLSDAFASGLEAGGDIPAMKHFPGIGYATLNTDSNVVTITASKTALAPGLLPYQKAIGNHIPLIMLSNATYSAYDPNNAAGWSHAISVDLLRGSLGYTAVSITDSLDGTAASRGVSEASLALKAASAGTDMILLSGSEATTSSTYSTLLFAAQNGTIPSTTLQASYNRIIALKTKLVAPPADATLPQVAAPISRVYALATLGSGTSPVRTYWSATDSCGISAHTLERMVNGGAWTVQNLPSTTTTYVDQSLSFGSIYRFVVKATDGAGNTSSWVYGAYFEPLLAEQSSSAITTTGTWTTVSNSHASGGSLKYSTASGASATFKFTGYGVNWVAYRGPDRGSATIYLDGVYYATVNLYSATYASKQIVYAANWGGNGTHTLKIVNLATPGHPRVDMDAFVRLYAT
ncbi:MAG TPA: glycoside hydrolase family 3 N-terminal domain-containing protein [Candidatus Limnocylindrales bacterium]